MIEVHEVLQVHAPSLVNTVGHSAGALLFGAFVVLLLGDRPAIRQAGNRKAIGAALLAFIWNLASLILVSMPGRLGPVWSTLSFSAVSLLPAVLFDLALTDRFRRLVLAGYGLSGVSIVMHCAEVAGGAAALHRQALVLSTTGFGFLTIAAAIGERRWNSRTLGTMSLFLFAMSFVHFDEAHPSWPIELLLHHAGIPLALFVLLQDYRSVLLDALVRVSANILLALGFAWVLTRWLRIDAVVAGAAALVIFAEVRAHVQNWLTRIVFGRPDLDGVLRQLRSLRLDEPAYLEEASRLTAAFMSADRVGGDIAPLDLSGPTLAAVLGDKRAPLESLGAQVAIPIRLGSAETRYILLGRRRGGRRYLSEDLHALSRIAAQIAEQIEEVREIELRRLVSQAELRALQSQINPHFLFNALNTLYGVIPREAAGARKTVLNLADIFRYFLNTEKTFIPLEEELRIVEAYLEIEALRLGSKLRTEMAIAPEAMAVQIPILSLQPIVENAVKHGVAASARGGLVRVEASIADGRIRLCVRDTGGGFESPGEKGAGVGLDNVRRRLALYYGPAAELAVESTTSGTAVTLMMPMEAAVAR